MASMKLSLLREFEIKELKTETIAPNNLDEKIAAFFDVASNVSIKHIKEMLVRHYILLPPREDGRWRVTRNQKKNKNEDSDLENLIEGLA